MALLTRGRALCALVIALTALLVVSPVLATASDPGAAAAKKAKKKCAKGKKKGCKKGKKKAKKKVAGGLPKPGTFLTSPNVRINVGLQYPGRILIVGVTIYNVTANCSDGSTRVVGGSVSTPLKSKSFSARNTYPAGNYAEAKGTFVSTTKATGTVRVGNVVLPDQTVCNTPELAFTAVKP